MTARIHDIAMLLPGVGVFGGVRRFLEIGNELVRRGHRATIYHESGERPEWMPFHGAVRPLRDVASSHDVVLCNDPPLFRRYETLPARLRIFYFAAERIPDEGNIVRSGWTLVANSESMARYVRRRYGVVPRRAVGGINLDLFRPLEVVRDPEEYRILCFGRVSRRSKGVGLVRRAVEGLANGLRRRRNGGVRRVKLVLFDHVGFGNERDPRPQFASAVPCEWHLNRPQEELASLYSSCDVFVNAERKAGWTNTVAEAMACGVPVVCTRSGTLDLARHGQTAWVVPFRHPWFLRRGLRALYDDPELAARLRGSALQQVRHFDWKAVTDQLLDVVRDCMPSEPVEQPASRS